MPTPTATRATAARATPNTRSATKPKQPAAAAVAPKRTQAKVAPTPTPTPAPASPPAPAPTAAPRAREVGVRLSQALEMAGLADDRERFAQLMVDRPRSDTYHRIYSGADLRHVRLALLEQAGITAPAGAAPGPALIPVYMAKGGVGKTAVAANVAVCLAQHGYATLLIDADPQSGTATNLFRVDASDGVPITHLGHLLDAHGDAADPRRAIVSIYADGMLDLIPADDTLAAANLSLVNRPWREQVFAKYLAEHAEAFAAYDAIVLDTGAAISPLNTAILNAAPRHFVAPVTLDGQVIKATSTLATQMARLNAGRTADLTPVIVANGYSDRPVARAALARLATEYGPLLCRRMIPHSPAFGRQFSLDAADEAHMPVIEREPSSAAARAMVDLTRALIPLFGVRLGGISDPRFELTALPAQASAALV